MESILYLFIAAVVGLIIGHCGEGDTHNRSRSAGEKFCQIIKWISIIILVLYVLIIIAALTDGIGDIPLLGGGAYWVRGHWRRRY